MPSVKCKECEEVLDEDFLVEVDLGIGVYEYWGAIGRDVRIETVTPCCHANYEEVDNAEDD